MSVIIVVFSVKVWVYGNSFRSALIAVVVPNEEITKKWAYSNGHKAHLSKLCSLGQLKKYVLSELKLTAERNKVLSLCDYFFTALFYIQFWVLQCFFSFSFNVPAEGF